MHNASAVAHLQPAATPDDRVSPTVPYPHRPRHRSDGPASGRSHHRRTQNPSGRWWPPRPPSRMPLTVETKLIALNVELGTGELVARFSETREFREQVVRHRGIVASGSDPPQPELLAKVDERTECLPCELGDIYVSGIFCETKAAGRERNPSDGHDTCRSSAVSQGCRRLEACRFRSGWARGRGDVRARVGDDTTRRKPPSLRSWRAATRLGNYSWMKRSVTTRTSTPLSSVLRNSIPLRQTDVVLLHRANGGDGGAIRFNTKSVHDAVSVGAAGCLVNGRSCDRGGPAGGVNGQDVP